MSEERLAQIVSDAVGAAVAPLQREVAELRRRLGSVTLTQAEVCAVYDVSPSTVYRAAVANKLTRLGSTKRPRYDPAECDLLFRAS